MSVLVFGATGQVGRELARHRGVTCLGRDRADLADPQGCAAAIRDHGPAAVINAAAWTAVDAAEAHEGEATVINGEAPGAMARECADLGIPFVTLSTDYVFDGSGGAARAVDDPVAPLNAYGRSKLAGERAVAAAGGAHVVLRTSWVVSAYGSNFVKTMLRLGRDRDVLRIVDDQVGGPTPARDIAAACLRLAGGLAADPARSGIHHFAGAPDVSWAGFAREIFGRTGIACAVEGIPTAEYPTPAARPLNSRLDCAALEADFGITRPDWRAGLDDILDELGAGP